MILTFQQALNRLYGGHKICKSHWTTTYWYLDTHTKGIYCYNGREDTCKLVEKFTQKMQEGEWEVLEDRPVYQQLYQYSVFDRGTEDWVTTTILRTKEEAAKHFRGRE